MPIKDRSELRQYDAERKNRHRLANPEREASRKAKWFAKNAERVQQQNAMRWQLAQTLKEAIPVVVPPKVLKMKVGNYRRQEAGGVAHVHFEDMTLQQIEQVIVREGGTFRVRNAAEQWEWIVERIKQDRRTDKPYVFLQGLVYVQRPGWYLPGELEEIARQARKAQGKKHPMAK